MKQPALTQNQVAAAVERAVARADGKAEVKKIAALDEFDYEREREKTAEALGVRVGVLDKMVKRARAEEDDSALPHWRVDASPVPVDGAALLDAVRAVFRRYVVMPKGADTALALWVMHTWTMNAGEISPFIVLVSPTKRCGKTTVLILLQYMTPRSELASNISASALFRYVEEVQPTLMIDEADSFIKDNEEIRGILNSGHTKTAAYVIRNVEVNGEHKPRRFSTWAPKAIATIRALADTLEDRSVVVTLQRKSPGAEVERLRRRDSKEFGEIRRKAKRWADDNIAKLDDPDPKLPDLNDRAADNWRPLIAIADLAGGTWPEDARRAAMTLSGDEDDGAINVALLRDIRSAFGDDDEIRSIDLVNKLTADPERPWVEWRHGRPLTQKQLGSLLSSFRLTSVTVSVPGFKDAKGYRRHDFQEAWAAYCPGQPTLPHQKGHSEASNRRSADATGKSGDFRSVAACPGDGSKNDELPNSHAGSDASTLRNNQTAAKGRSAQEFDDMPPFLRRCGHCGKPSPTARWDWEGHPDGVWLHTDCEAAWASREARPNLMTEYAGTGTRHYTLSTDPRAYQQYATVTPSSLRFVVAGSQREEGQDG
jgi:Protein of unknown function (DUF3631)